MKINDSLIYDSLKKIFGFDEFKGLQKEVIRNICDGKNTFVIMPTGGGKSLCYQLPALIKEGTTVGLANGSLEADEKEIYTAENLKVGLFK